MYHAIPTEMMVSRFLAAGFTKEVRNHEVVFSRPLNSNPAVKVLVYTSLTVDATVCRAKGADAIRVCATYTGKAGTRGLFKLPRVNRTGTPEAVIERTVERARTAWAKAAAMSKNVCKCGAPRYVETNSCVAKCWAVPATNAVAVMKNAFHAP